MLRIKVNANNAAIDLLVSFDKEHKKANLLPEDVGLFILEICVEKYYTPIILNSDGLKYCSVIQVTISFGPSENLAANLAFILYKHIWTF
jgi:hypothetical protein